LAALLVVVFLAGDVPAVVFDAEPLEAVVFDAVVRAAVFFAVEVAVAFFAGAFFAVAFFAVLFDAVLFEAVLLDAVLFEAVLVEAVLFDAVLFDGLAFVVDLELGDVVLVFLAGDVRDVVDFVVLAFFAGVEDALLAVVVDALFAAPVAARVVEAAAVSVSLGSFFAPDTTALRSAPGLNFGMRVFLALMRSPVRGLRTHRASRSLLSKEPKPVMATFSPLATSRVIVSITDSSACAACLRLPSYRAARVSIN
jgi:hypothetical protein